jgi:glycosyltransferase involved in cell wall biosynthesis
MSCRYLQSVDELIVTNGQIDLLWLGGSDLKPDWTAGDIWAVDANVRAIHNLLEEQLNKSPAVGWLLWDATFGSPKVHVAQHYLAKSADVWHAGLQLGMKGAPGALDFVAPTWMLNCDADPGIESTSWRLSHRACLVRTEVLKAMGHVRPDFQTLEAAMLEMGHRYITRGVLTRHVPDLIPAAEPKTAILPFADELRFIYYRFGHFWSGWTLMRAVLSGYVAVAPALKAWREITRIPAPKNPDPYVHANLIVGGALPASTVSVLIPTLDRYPYLRMLLDQLQRQTIKPHEVIVVDQTSVRHRDLALAADYRDLPLKLIYQDQPGQCSSRNEGLNSATGDHILFLDDDDEVPQTLIEKHLESLTAFDADVSSGVADESGAGPLPDNFLYTRASDVFPTNNTLVRKAVLQRSGLFDLAYDRGQRADGDLGMRVYLSGAAMILNSQISVVHHHAPVGGLRVHKARVKTYAASRTRLNVRQLTSATEVYLAKRYFTPRQLREMLWLQVFGTFSFRGSALKRVIKFFLGLVYMPNTLLELNKKYRQATTMSEIYPQIPLLDQANS